jgi:hypothetical protein
VQYHRDRRDVPQPSLFAANSPGCHDVLHGKPL